MMRLSVVTLAVFGVAVVFCTVQALECGIDSSSNSKDLRQIAENCMKKKAEEKPKASSDPEDEEDMKEGSTESYGGMKRNKRSDENSQNNRQSSSVNNNDPKNGENNNGNNTAAEKDNCVVHCIFGQLGMVDGDGFPVHHRVLNALLNNARGRELRDFVQDTTDECFQLMEQGDHHDACQYSVTLVNCLAERGKSNCADWPIGNLPFLSKKN